jgi:hypothetical protein
MRRDEADLLRKIVAMPKPFWQPEVIAPRSMR